MTFFHPRRSARKASCLGISIAAKWSSHWN